ncbi:hypothetical protein Bhyg_08218 [Pseudolycoriella hygida]|uniref:Uncharacterized protein n=1 Tax=Pseudolycoriella hygida TaxID=35572 RepID=A0A9Q0S4Q2_9DIPT|nr:hypothetical protein Bhyg_08218 [Pseudolycoriella hygida]
MMKLFFLFVVLIAINNIVAATPRSNDDYGAFVVPRPKICVDSKKEIYTKLIKKSNSNFIMAYQRHMPKSCSFSSEVVRIVEAYRNAANYVVIFLNKSDRTDEQFDEVVQLYNIQLNKFNEAIRKMIVTRNFSNLCYNALMLIQRAVTTTGEGLVAGTILTFTHQCSANRADRTSTHRSIEFVSNNLYE